MNKSLSVRKRDLKLEQTLESWGGGLGGVNKRTERGKGGEKSELTVDCNKF